MTCQNCHQPLSASQWSKSETWKSCPNCSQDDGAQHVFHVFPSDFGQTDARSSSPHPEGPQSYCNECRGRGAVSLTKACADVTQGALTKAAPVAPTVRKKT